jgi:hypothetical protein
MSEPRFSHHFALPPDLNLAIMIVLSFHLGRDNPISPSYLCAALRELDLDERKLRAHIEGLRRSGHLIGSVGGEADHPERTPSSARGNSKDLENGGYFLIINQEELEDFLQREYLAKIDEMQLTMEAMIEAASQRWGYYSIQRKRF